LYHWDLPQALQDKYKGWQSRDVISDFGDYSTAVVSRLGDKINHWMTINEVSSMSYVGYKVHNSWEGLHAPGIQLASDKERYQLIHNILLAHGTSVQAIRAASPQKCFVSIANDQVNYVPAFESPENILATKKAFLRDEKNGGIIVPILTGKYDEGWLKDCGNQAPEVLPGDMKLISQPLDLLGFNCYTGFYV
jgi:beta-glucosidase